MKTPNIDFMMQYVQDYLDGKMKRWEFDLDFDHHIIKRYAKMERENPELAEAFGFYISENAVDCSQGLSDDEFKKLVRKQYNKLETVIQDGFC